MSEPTEREWLEGLRLEDEMEFYHRTDASLREKLIEAGGARIWRYDDSPENGRVRAREDAAAALDAFLDCLAENADEWFDAWTDWEDKDGDPKFVGLLAALRESDDE